MQISVTVDMDDGLTPAQVSRALQVACWAASDAVLSNSEPLPIDHNVELDTGAVVGVRNAVLFRTE